MVDDKASRFIEYLECVRTAGHMSQMSTYPGLRQQAFHDPSAFPIVAELEREYPRIRTEVDALAADWFQRQAEGVQRSGAWKVFMLYERGRRHDDHCRQCPVLTDVVERHRTVRTLAGIAYISRTEPGTRIAPHVGPTNMRLRCHLGLRVPDGDCGLRVGDALRSWEAGKCLVFDDSLEHESWNHTDTARTVAIIDLWHPDLTDEEVRLLESLHGYAAAHAENLTRYWAANERQREQLRERVS